MIRLVAAAILLAATLVGGVRWAAAQEEPAWDILDARSGARVDADQFHERISQTDILLLGEIHDNPRHHTAQAHIMRLRFAGTSDTARGAVVFEMLTRAQQPVVDAFAGSADGFADAMGWNESGWPDAAIYQPVFDAAFAAGARLIAGDLARDTLKSLYGTGPEILPPDVLAVYRLFDPLPEAVQREMTELQFDAHCGVFPRDRLDAMVTIQRARDAALARAVIAAFEASGGPVVLIAGSGHTRLDYGAGKLLHLALPDANILAIGMVERDKSTDIPAPYDWVIATDPHRRPDPCEELRKSHGEGHSD